MKMNERNKIVYIKTSNEHRKHKLDHNYLIRNFCVISNWDELTLMIELKLKDCLLLKINNTQFRSSNNYQPSGPLIPLDYKKKKKNWRKFYVPYDHLNLTVL